MDYIPIGSTGPAEVSDETKKMEKSERGMADDALVALVQAAGDRNCRDFDIRIEMTGQYRKDQHGPVTFYLMLFFGGKEEQRDIAQLANHTRRFPISPVQYCIHSEDLDSNPKGDSKYGYIQDEVVRLCLNRSGFDDIDKGTPPPIFYFVIIHKPWGECDDAEKSTRFLSASFWEDTSYSSVHQQMAARLFKTMVERQTGEPL